MNKDMATFWLESYEMDYSDLELVVGEQFALGKVALYLRKPFSDNPLIQGSRLLKTFLERTGSEADAFLCPAVSTFTPPSPPELTDEEYYDPSDKGLTRFLPGRTSKPNCKKTRAAWRVKRNG